MDTLIAEGIDFIDDLASRGGQKTLNLIQEAVRQMSKEASLQRALTILILVAAINLASAHDPSKEDLLMATGNFAWIYSSWTLGLLACGFYCLDRRLRNERPKKIKEALLDGHLFRWYAWGGFLQIAIGLTPLLIGQTSYPGVVISFILIRIVSIWAAYTIYVLFGGGSSSRRKKKVEQKESLIEAVRRRFFAVAPSPAN